MSDPFNLTHICHFFVYFSFLIEVYIGRNNSIGYELSFAWSLRPEWMSRGRWRVRENNCHVVTTFINFEIEQLWAFDRENLFHLLWTMSGAKGECTYTYEEKGHFPIKIFMKN